MIHPDRLRQLNDQPIRNKSYVLYWMQASQRAVHNHALEYAIAQANSLGQPVMVGFGLMDDYPEANERHYAFMLEGLAAVNQGLEERGIPFVIRRGSPPDAALRLGADASMIVCDRGYLRHQRKWRDDVASKAHCRVMQVESDVVVPVESASGKLEFAARTIRPKINRLVEEHLHAELRPARLKAHLTSALKSDIDLTNIDKALAKLKIDRVVQRTNFLIGGYPDAKKHLNQFIKDHLPSYSTGRKDLRAFRTSLLAAYLHFGQISPSEIAIAVGQSSAPATEKETYLEELIVRRELAMNFVYYQPAYDQYSGLPAWSRATLREHARDERTYHYSRALLEAAETHDPYWNAAQRQMVSTGFMHNMMRMYWGKKILEWKNDPEEAFSDAIYLNNRYFLCGRDPASYANVGWLFGLHDRPWQKRKIFGTVRYMNAAGLERKFDMDGYVRQFGERS